jgi:hypothetical protein
MDYYTCWLIRSRVIAFVGVVLFIGSIWLPWLRDWEFSWVTLFLGFAALAAGLLDGFGLIQRKKIRQAIIEHDQKRREQFKSRQPWE